MANIHGLKSGSNDDDADKDSLYVGGAGRNGGSGQAVYGPGPGSGINEDVMGKIISQAQRSGAFNGSGAGPQKVVTVWKNGFKVDDGPFRPITVMRNKAFLDDLSQGNAPRELQAGSPGQDVEVKVIDKSAETFGEDESKFQAFSGGGQTLGGSGAAAAAAAAAAAPSSAPTKLVVDESAPTTQIQVRLANRKRLVIRCNLSHTIQNLHSHIEAEAPETAPFALLAGFPPKPISDYAQSVEAAGLANSAITQKKC